MYGYPLMILVFIQAAVGSIVCFKKYITWKKTNKTNKKS